MLLVYIDLLHNFCLDHKQIWSLQLLIKNIMNNSPMRRRLLERCDFWLESADLYAQWASMNTGIFSKEISTVDKGRIKCLSGSVWRPLCCSPGFL